MAKHLTHCLLVTGLVCASSAADAPALVIDMAALNTSLDGLVRVYGSTGDGSKGVPVAAGSDVDGDGFEDYAFAALQASPLGRSGAGQVFLVFGNGAVEGTMDTAVAHERILSILGDGTKENTGSEIWMDDVTGDVTDDGIADLVVGADQRGASHNGAVYVVRGGAHLATGQTFDLADFGTLGFGLAGHLARIDPPASSSHYHFGATVQIGDVDGNQIGEVLIAATLNRSGATLQADGGGGSHGSGGTPHGTLYIVWDEEFLGVWVDDYSFVVDAPGLDTTTIHGASENRSFGEEMLAGKDYNGDGTTDLFVADLVGTASGRSNAGLAYVLFDSVNLKDRVFTLPHIPAGVTMTTFLGPRADALAGDTALDGDFNGDGITDIAFSSPHDSPMSRTSAGTVHVVFGQTAAWPAVVDLAAGELPPPAALRVAEIYGALGTDGADHGDTLAYSGSSADVDGDGCTDLVLNEMTGNGIGPGTIDVGNLIVIDGKHLGCPLFQDGFESGDTSAWTRQQP